MMLQSVTLSLLVALAAGAVFRDCGDCPEMVVIPAGNFSMGSPANEAGRFDDESPQRRVRVNALAAGKYDITRGQWARFAAATKRPTAGGCTWSALPDSKPGEPNPSASWRNLGFDQDDSHPIVCVTFEDAQAYTRWLAKRTGKPYRLLTEAEWEYAARAGTTTAFSSGATISHELANYGPDDEPGTGVASGRDQWLYTSPVGAFPPNAFGLYDMQGNVLQWVQDCYAGSYIGAPVDGSADLADHTLTLTGDLAGYSGTRSCMYRVARGGDWGDPPRMIRSAARNFASPLGQTLQHYKSSGLGFRVARSIE
jgi:formylglycine-generating enzyme required for sulfatase activity